MSDAVTATDEGQQEKLFRQAGNIIEKSLEKVRIEFFTLVWDHSIITSGMRWVGRGGQMLMFADKMGGSGWPKADVSKK